MVHFTSAHMFLKFGHLSYKDIFTNLTELQGVT